MIAHLCDPHMGIHAKRGIMFRFQFGRCACLVLAFVMVLSFGFMLYLVSLVKWIKVHK